MGSRLPSRPERPSNRTNEVGDTADSQEAGKCPWSIGRFGGRNTCVEQCPNNDNPQAATPGKCWRRTGATRS